VAFRGDLGPGVSTMSAPIDDLKIRRIKEPEPVRRPVRSVRSVRSRFAGQLWCVLGVANTQQHDHHWRSMRRSCGWVQPIRNRPGLLRGGLFTPPRALVLEVISAIARRRWR
jgi:hypothetical protein